MAGFQQAANALTGSIGTVGSRIGVYNELVGKNQKSIKELEQKNEEITDLYETLKAQSDLYENELGAIRQKEYETQMKRQQRIEAEKEHEKIIERRLYRKWENNTSHMSKNMMLNTLYGDFASGSGGGI